MSQSPEGLRGSTEEVWVRVIRGMCPGGLLWRWKELGFGDELSPNNVPDGEDPNGFSRKETAVQWWVGGSAMTCQQQKSVTNYSCLSLVVVVGFLYILGGFGSTRSSYKEKLEDWKHLQWFSFSFPASFVCFFPFESFQRTAATYISGVWAIVSFLHNSENKFYRTNPKNHGVLPCLSGLRAGKRQLVPLMPVCFSAPPHRQSFLFVWLDFQPCEKCVLQREEESGRAGRGGRAHGWLWKPCATH